MQDAPARVFVAGPRAEPGPALDAWLAAHAGHEVHLPFTVWRDALGHVAGVAVGDASAPSALRLSDAALGIPLRDRLRATFGDATRCAVILSGRFGAVEPLAAAAPVFSVTAFHGAVEGEVSAAAAREPGCLAIRAMRAVHCARGPAACAECRWAAEAPPRPRLLDLCPDDADRVARPVVEITREGRVEHRVYDVLRVFADADEARAFAAAHGVADVLLA